MPLLVRLHIAFGDKFHVAVLTFKIFNAYMSFDMAFECLFQFIYLIVAVWMGGNPTGRGTLENPRDPMGRIPDLPI